MDRSDRSLHRDEGHTFRLCLRGRQQDAARERVQEWNGRELQCGGRDSGHQRRRHHVGAGAVRRRAVLRRLCLVQILDVEPTVERSGRRAEDQHHLVDQLLAEHPLYQLRQRIDMDRPVGLLGSLRGRRRRAHRNPQERFTRRSLGVRSGHGHHPQAVQLARHPVPRRSEANRPRLPPARQERQRDGLVGKFIDSPVPYDSASNTDQLAFDSVANALFMSAPKSTGKFVWMYAFPN